MPVILASIYYFLLFLCFVVFSPVANHLQRRWQYPILIGAISTHAGLFLSLIFIAQGGSWPQSISFGAMTTGSIYICLATFAMINALINNAVVLSRTQIEKRYAEMGEQLKAANQEYAELGKKLSQPSTEQVRGGNNV